MGKIEVVRKADLAKTISTAGVVRNKAFETDSILYAQSRITGKVVAGWHHHGKRGLYGYLVSGRLRIEYEGGKADMGAGDFFHIPMGLVHRDINPGAREAVVVNIILGSGPPIVNVEPREPVRARRKRVP